MNKAKNLTVFLEVAKNKSGNKYVVLKTDLGYRSIPLTFDETMIAEILGLTMSELYELKNSAEV